MANESTTHKVNHTFEIEIEQSDEEKKDRRYEAYCNGLTGCRVYASSKAKALRKIRPDIDIWLDLADRQFTDARIVHDLRLVAIGSQPVMHIILLFLRKVFSLSSNQQFNVS